MADIKITDLVELTQNDAGDFFLVVDISDAGEQNKKIRGDKVFISLSSQIANGIITGEKLANGAVSGSKIASDSIDSQHYVDGSIDSAHIGNSQITNTKLGLASVTGTKIANGTIVADNLSNGAVIPAKTSFFEGTNIYFGRVASTGSAVKLPTGWSSSRTALGKYRVTHNLGSTSYVALVTSEGKFPALTVIGSSYFDLSTFGHDNATGDMWYYDSAFHFIVIRY